MRRSGPIIRMYDRRAGRRGMLLLVVLMIVSVLALLGTSFAFRMSADMSAVKAVRASQQARLAADSGLARVMLYLREYRNNAFGDGEDAGWYDNPDMFRRIVVWAPWVPDEIGGTTNLDHKNIEEGQPAYRFSVVANQPISEGQVADEEDEKYPRYGLSDEAGRINLNVASRGQLLALFDQLEMEDVYPVELADALIDWRDADDKETGLNGAESSYYIRMNPPYRCKNGPLGSLEELLMVRGFTGRVLYGEDYNRNGYLDENEDDGQDGVFPPDNEDGELERGILPFVTVYSWDFNSANDNKPRLNLNSVDFDDSEQVEEELLEEFSEDLIDFITEVRQRGYKFRSVGELAGLKVWEDGSSNYDKPWEKHLKALEKANKAGTQAEEGSEESLRDVREREEDEKDKPDIKLEEDEDPLKGLDELDVEELGNDRGSRDKRKNKDRGRKPIVEDPNSGTDVITGEVKKTPESANPDNAEDGSGDQGKKKKKKKKGTPIESPIEGEDLAVAMDRFTALPLPVIPGLINVNTASAAVLRTIPGLSDDQVDAIVEQREQASAEDKLTLAWLVNQNVLEPKTFAMVSNQLTTRSLQFTVEVVGFADHLALAKRIQAVVEMRGQVAQIKYYRDLSELGVGYQVWAEDEY